MNKSAASAASLEGVFQPCISGLLAQPPRRPKTRQKNYEKMSLEALYIRIPRGSQVETAVKSPKMGLPITPRPFLQRPSFFAMFGGTSGLGQIFQKNITKTMFVAFSDPLCRDVMIEGIDCFLLRDAHGPAAVGNIELRN